MKDLTFSCLKCASVIIFQSLIMQITCAGLAKESPRGNCLVSPIHSITCFQGHLQRDFPKGSKTFPISPRLELHVSIQKEFACFIRPWPWRGKKKCVLSSPLSVPFLASGVRCSRRRSPCLACPTACSTYSIASQPARLPACLPAPFPL